MHRWVRLASALLALTALACADEGRTSGPTTPFGSLTITGDASVPGSFRPDSFDGDPEIWIFGQDDTTYVTVFWSFELGVFQLTVQHDDRAWEVRSLPVPGVQVSGNTATFAGATVPEIDLAQPGTSSLTLDGSLRRR